MSAAGELGAPPHTPVFHYRERVGRPWTRMSRAMLLRHILAPAGVVDAHSFTLTRFHPGGATDLAVAGVDDTVVKKIGKCRPSTAWFPTIVTITNYSTVFSSTATRYSPFSWAQLRNWPLRPGEGVGSASGLSRSLSARIGTDRISVMEG